MLRVVAAMAALAIGATVVLAQNAAVIEQRKQAMKAFGGAAKGPGAMNKGDAPFELPKVQASLKTIQETAVKAKDLFPDDSKVGETDALPAAFEKKADLLARLDSLAAAAKSAEGAIKDEATFKAEWPKVVSQCGGCHKEYRKPK
ncbi:MAG TPA: cytochrome c [Hyphomicrobiaceae bacterium]|jgi:cytochrome c556|nr:cytochrome c [Hyphomicrobiaceae bacterium]